MNVTKLTPRHLLGGTFVSDSGVLLTTVEFNPIYEKIIRDLGTGIYMASREAPRTPEDWMEVGVFRVLTGTPSRVRFLPFSCPSGVFRTTYTGEFDPHYEEVRLDDGLSFHRTTLECSHTDGTNGDRA